MIVRESPKSKVKTNQPNWPPQSPVEALLSSPSGRRKYEQRRERASVSPSPSKRRPMSQNALQDDDNDDEEDEETLQLKLQAIEAKLKLKALQRARKAAEGADTESNTSSSRPPTAASMRRVDLPRPGADVQVPHSPMRQRRAPQEPRSPARVLLGIDKGLRAQDVSLKRPGASITGGDSRSNSARSDPPQIKSFSERMAESRNKEKEREENKVKVEMRRSRGFGLHSIEGLKSTVAPRSGSSLSSGTRATQDMPPPSAKALSGTQSRPMNEPRHPPTPRPSSNSATQRESSRSSVICFETSVDWLWKYTNHIKIRRDFATRQQQRSTKF